MTISLRQISLYLGLIVALCYIPSLGGSYHFDDTHSIQMNVSVQSLSHIPSFWTDPRTSSFIPENRVYRPLTYTFYAVCWAIGGGLPWPFHAMKIVFHFLVCLALYLIWSELWSLPGWFPLAGLKIDFKPFKGHLNITPASTAFILAILFAIHPACSECVDYIAATTSLQCALFYVWAFLAYLTFRRSKRKRFLFASLFLFFCSVATKEEGITLPAMVLVTEIFLGSGGAFHRLKSAVKTALPFVVVALVLVFWIYLMHPVSGNESRGYVTSFEYFITQWRAYLWYMRLWFWPWDLNADSASMEFSKSLTQPLVIQSAIGNFILIFISWLLRKKMPALLFGLIWFYVTISPASSVVVLAEAVNEHRMYLAYIGFVGGTLTLFLFIMNSLLGKELLSRWIGPVLLAVCVGLLIGTQERNRVWASNESLWTDTVEKNPTSGRALNNLALVYMERGEYEKAIQYFLKCEGYWKSYLYCPLNLGISYFAMGKNAEEAQKKEDEIESLYKKADEALQRAYSLNSRNVHTNYNLGRLYEEAKKDCSKALEYFSKAIELTEGIHPAAEAHLANCYSETGRNEEAIRAVNHAWSLEPDNGQVLLSKGKVELKTHRVAEALQTLQNLVQLYPDEGEGWSYLVTAAETQGDLPLAVHAAQQLVTLRPDNELFRIQLRKLKGELEAGMKKK